MDTIIPSLQTWFRGWGLLPIWASVAAQAVVVVAVVVLALLANLVAKQVILKVVQRVIKKTTFTWDDVFVERKVFTRASQLAPALVIYLLANRAFIGHENLIRTTESATIIYMIIVLMRVLNAVLDAVVEIYSRFEIAQRMPIIGMVQASKIVVFFLAGILTLSVILGKSPMFLLGGLGALTAVLMLVFKDTILGFVSSIQLSTNNMVRVGDWISMPAQGADGDVIDISLTSVKVMNWDKTITTIPIYALVSQSFKNWRGMAESGGRRIKRSLHIDTGSIRFCDDEMLERFSKFRLIADYLTNKRAEIAEYNRAHDIAEGTIDGRRLTNIGTFRSYIVEYLKKHPKIHQEMTFLVRQLPVGPNGLPIELYVFSNDQEWGNYEAIQGDIFDHLLAVVPEFGLRIFQNPTGADLRGLVRKGPSNADQRRVA